MAMRAATPARPAGPEVLRVGVLVDGRIVEERVLPRRAAIQIGTDERNDVVVRTRALPPRFTMFEPAGDRWVLHVPEGANGRVAGRGGMHDLAALRERQVRSVGLEPGARGKVSIGGVTLLFQLVPPPPVQVRPQLPASARSGFFRQVDWLFTAFATMSLLAHFGFVIFLENADWSVSEPLAETEARIAMLIFPEPEPPPDPMVPPEDTTDADTTDTSHPVADDTNPNPVTGPRRPRPGPAQPSIDRDAIAQEASDAAIALLGSIGPGSFSNLLEGGMPMESQARLFDDIHSTSVASNDPGTMRTRDRGGDGPTGDISSLRRSGDGTETQQRDEGTPVREHIITIANPDPDEIDPIGDGEFDSRQVVAAIRRRVPRIQACYEHIIGAVGVDGKITVAFTIEEAGSVSRLRVIENTAQSEQLAGCVTRNLSGLRFNPGPTGGSVSYSYPFVFTAQR